MAAAYRSSTSTNTGTTAATTLAVTVPTTQYHDILIAALAIDGSASTVNTPTGWTLLRNTISAGANLRSAIFWRLVDGTETAAYTWTFDSARQAAATMTAYSGAAITPPPSNSSVSTTTAGTSLAGSGTNSSYETGLGLQFFSSRNATAATTQTANAAYTKREDTCTTASIFIGLTMQDNIKTLPMTSTSATGNLISTASTSICISVFIEDARVPFLPLAADQYFVGSINTSAANTPTAIETNVPNVTMLAWITINKDVQTVSSIATAGVTWTFVTRVNTNAGSVELWQAFIATPIALTTTTITFSGSVVSANFMFSGIINADFTGTNGSAAIGAISSNSFTASAATTSVTTTRNNSWVWAIMNSSTTASSPTAGSAQTIIRTQTDGTNTTQSAMWRQTARTPLAGTNVTVNLTVPASSTGNILAVEILPQQIYNLSMLGLG